MPWCLSLSSKTDEWDVPSFRLKRVSACQGWQVILAWTKFVKIGAMGFFVLLFWGACEDVKLAWVGDCAHGAISVETGRLIDHHIVACGSYLINHDLIVHGAGVFGY